MDDTKSESQPEKIKSKSWLEKAVGIGALVAVVVSIVSLCLSTVQTREATSLSKKSLALSQQAYNASQPTLALKPVIYGTSTTKSSSPNSADLLVEIALQNLGTKSLVACDTLWEYTTLSGTPLLYLPTLVEDGGAVWMLSGGQVHETRATLTVEPDPKAGVGETAYIAFWFECQAPNLVTAAEVVEVDLRTGTIPDESTFGVEQLPPMSALQREQKIMKEYHETVPSSPPSIPPYKLEPAV
jgi:hypothetical protein